MVFIRGPKSTGLASLQVDSGASNRVPLRTVSISVPTPAPHAGAPIPAVRITSDLAVAAAARLVSQSNTDIETAARRLVASAPEHGIDLSLIWGTVEGARAKRKVRQACLVVLGAGRTA